MKDCIAFTNIISIGLSFLLLLLGGIFGFSSLQCDCPSTFQDLPVTKIKARSSACLATNGTILIQVNKVCTRFDNYEVAIVFFGLGILILPLLFIFNLIICYKKNQKENLPPQNKPQPLDLQTV